MAAYPIRTITPPGTLHSFPAPTPHPARMTPRRTPRYFSEVQTLDPEGAQQLLGVTKDLIERAQVLIEHMDENRHEARMSGVETIAIELSAILEGGKLSNVEDALEEAVKTGAYPAISIEGFSKLRRVEFLISEVDHSIQRYVETPVHEMGRSAWPPYGAPRMGTSLSEIPMPILLLGVIGAGAILAVVILALTKK